MEDIWHKSYIPAFCKNRSHGRCPPGIPVPAVHKGKVGRDFPFGTHAKIELVIHFLKRIEIKPELRFGKEYEFVLVSVHVGVLLTPEVGKSREREHSFTEIEIPCSCKLEIAWRFVAVYILVHCRHRESLREMELL